MKASGELVVHEARIGENPLDAPWIDQGEGSFFVSRVNEVVVLAPQAAEGLRKLPEAVERMVAKGLHNLVVNFSALNDVATEDLKELVKVREILDRCVGSLRLSSVSGGLKHRLKTLGVTDGVPVLDGDDAAVEDYRQSLGEDGEPLDAGKSEDLTASSSDGVEDPNDWGWGSQDAVADPAQGLPSVSVAELLVQDDELLNLPKQVVQIVTKNEKRYVSLRLHFGRKMTSQDVNVLISVRDYLAGQGGQLALVSLQKDVSKWLKLLEFDREFVVADDSDAADQLHRRHAAGEATAPVKPKKTARATPPKAAAPPPKTAAPPPRPAPVASGGDKSGELERLRGELAAARSQAEAFKQQLGDLQSGLQRAESTQGQSSERIGQLTQSLRQTEQRLQQLEQARQKAEQRAVEAESNQEQARARAGQLESEVKGLRQQLEAARKDAAPKAELERSRTEVANLRSSLSDMERELTAAKAQAEEAQRVAAGLKSQIAASATGDSGALKLQIAGLEEEKARILTEAEVEIRRLTGEREMLRDELQSAGEMIERLGKELELS